MPRAFLLTHRRYNMEDDADEKGKYANEVLITINLQIFHCMFESN